MSIHLPARCHGSAEPTDQGRLLGIALYRLHAPEAGVRAPSQGHAASARPAPDLGSALGTFAPRGSVIAQVAPEACIVVLDHYSREEDVVGEAEYIRRSAESRMAKDDPTARVRMNVVVHSAATAGAAEDTVSGATIRSIDSARHRSTDPIRRMGTRDGH
jgi:hypothetical protein